MSEAIGQRLLNIVLRCGRLAERGLISGPEFTGAVLDTFAGTGPADPDIAPALWSAVPAPVRDEFTAARRNAIPPGFRYHAFLRGGGRPMTEEELRQDARLLTDRVRSWAVELLRRVDETR